MATFQNLVVMDEFGISAFRPTPGSLIELARKYADGHRDGYILEIKERKFVFPIKTSRGNPGVRQPVECDVVEDIVTCKLVAGLSFRQRTQGRSERSCRLGISITEIY